MPVGLQIVDANGQVIIDVSYRVMKVLTVEMINGASGNTTIPTGAYAVSPIAAPMTADDRNKALPRASVSGSSVSWDYASVPTAQRANTRLILSAY